MGGRDAPQNGEGPPLPAIPLLVTGSRSLGLEVTGARALAQGVKRVQPSYQRPAPVAPGSTAPM